MAANLKSSLHDEYPWQICQDTPILSVITSISSVTNREKHRIAPQTVTVLPARRAQLRRHDSRLSHLPLDRCALKFMKSFSSQAIGLLKRMVDALSLDIYYSFASISVL